MATEVVVVKFIWRHSIARPRKPHVIRKDLGDISYIGRVIEDFVPNFVAMATRLVAGQFGWHHSIARPRKAPIGRNNLANICYISRVIADFFQNSVAMATVVILGPAYNQSLFFLNFAVRTL